MSVIDRIIELQTENNLRDKDFEVAVGLSNSSMNKWKKGRQSPNTDNLIAIAQHWMSNPIIHGSLLIRTVSRKQRENYYRNHPKVRS